MVWLPFEYRESLSPRLLRICWIHTINNVGTIYYSDYPIGRFPPIYDVVLLGRFRNHFSVGAKKNCPARI